LIKNFQSLYHILAAQTGQSNGIHAAMTDKELAIIVATPRSMV